MSLPVNKKRKLLGLTLQALDEPEEYMSKSNRTMFALIGVGSLGLALAFFLQSQGSTSPFVVSTAGACGFLAGRGTFLREALRGWPVVSRHFDKDGMRQHLKSLQ